MTLSRVTGKQCPWLRLKEWWWKLRHPPVRGEPPPEFYRPGEFFMVLRTGEVWRIESIADEDLTAPFWAQRHFPARVHSVNLSTGERQAWPMAALWGAQVTRVCGQRPVVYLNRYHRLASRNVLGSQITSSSNGLGLQAGFGVNEALYR